MFPNSTYAESVDFAFWFIVGISFTLLVLITILMIYFVFKYNRKKQVKAENIHGNLTLEIVWTVIPVLLTLGMFYYGWMGYQDLSNPPSDAMVVKSTGQMWKWTYEYNNGLVTDTLFVPVNRAVKIDLVSADVNHSFFIPAFRIKRDVLPNRENFVWFKAENTGSFDIACAEYCGLQHSYMYSKVVVLPENEYDLWFKNASEKKDISSTDSTQTLN
ncbi:MAG: cytochrome c oxidase subunit II [Ignavibacteriaceae bacterium]|nr:cytochrome c oxidase subunit II [Ignavibacteriaceae bacterium]HRI45568.1 cytochrome c oxidase subunit II [Ignavibacteriaceae bacterium]